MSEYNIFERSFYASHCKEGVLPYLVAPCRFSFPMSSQPALRLYRLKPVLSWTSRYGFTGLLPLNDASIVGCELPSGLAFWRAKLRRTSKTAAISVSPVTFNLGKLICK